MTSVYDKLSYKTQTEINVISPLAKFSYMVKYVEKMTRQKNWAMTIP
ncbi:hypothetical protein ACFSUS_19260 [Spirosoma soli]|uniref:Uncharacterized protein n=1 Tax=Spirosoma soli TaxID=1770529 RepID=A0ABW5M969_9BACT